MQISKQTYHGRVYWIFLLFDIVKLSQIWASNLIIDYVNHGQALLLDSYVVKKFLRSVQQGVDFLNHDFL